MDHPLPSMAVALAVGSALVYIGALVFRRLGAPPLACFAFGGIALGAGVLLGYPLVLGTSHPLSYPLQLGVAVGLAGLGINQLAAPVRAKHRGAA